MFLSIWLCFLLFQFFPNASPTDTLTATEFITDGQTLVSSGSNFALGFFSPGNSSYRYVGIWYYKIPETTVVWVANRDNPLNESSGVLSFALDGNLIISSPSDQSHPLWSTNVSISSNTTVLKLLNSGNLVLYSSSNTNTVLWQTFDHPTDMWLPGMKLGWDWRIGLNRLLTSWTSKDDPGRGIYSFELDPRGSPQFFLYKDSTPLWRSGHWNGRALSGVPEMTQSYIFKDDFVNTADELYMIYAIRNPSIFSTSVMDYSGTFQKMTWVETSRQWNRFFSVPTDKCEYYGHCGANGICTTENSVECACLPGFEPKSPTDWYLREWSDGCVRKRTLWCREGDGFLKLVSLKSPDTSMSLVHKNLSLKECERECLKNCSCTAYTPADITGGGSGCIVWFGNLMDIQRYADGGQDLYLHVDRVELGSYACLFSSLDHLYIHVLSVGFHHHRYGIEPTSISVGLTCYEW